MDNIRIVEKCKSGDREAFELLYETYLPVMWEIVAHYIHNSDTIWDIIHDGFIIAFTSLETLRDGSKVEAWLTTIMKNLSLQYLREESKHITVPISDAVSDDEITTGDNDARELTWEELDKIIDKLPKGYNKVFRLAVLDGFSHKEIAAQLGIAPHSSSSQLTHAKAMLRRLIMKYRTEMGLLSIIGLIWLIWHGFYKQRGETPSAPIISKNTDNEVIISNDSIKDYDSKIDSIMPKSKMINKTIRNPETQHNFTDATISNDSMPTVSNDSIPPINNGSASNDTVKVIPNALNQRDPITQNEIPLKLAKEMHDWSLSLAYASSLEQNDLNRYLMPNPDAPDAEGPADEINVTEMTRHCMPLVIGLSVNKHLNSRLSVETGLRYTFLRSDYCTESDLMKKEIIQRIHYIGVDIKFNYRIVTYNGFSMYGQGGGGLDIPVHGTQYIWEHYPKFETMYKDVHNIHAPVQWSLEGGLGIQYNFTPAFSVYAEPSLRYFFNTGSDIKTIRQDKPFEFTIPIGLRWTW